MAGELVISSTSVDFRREDQAPDQHLAKDLPRLRRLPPEQALPVCQSIAEVASHVGGIERRDARGSRERAKLNDEVITPRLALAQLAEQRRERADFGDRARVARDLLLEIDQLGFERAPAVRDLGA